MSNNGMLALSGSEATELKAILDAEMERRLENIHDLLQARYTTMGGYKEPETWAEVKAKVVELTLSPLPSMKQRLAALLDTVKAAAAEAPGSG